ncbi:MAG: hypothetical protein ACW97O_09650 [Candidatus Thorarchaeota archaeon]|jgi:hypothetical protein
MRKLTAVVLAVVVLLTIGGGVAFAAFGDVVTSFTPTPSGNGRAVAFDGTDLYYTYFGGANDTYIYRVATDGTAIDSWDTGVQIGALAWDSSRGKLWAGQYDGSGNVSLVDYQAQTVEYMFSFNGTDPDALLPGWIDGLVYDEESDTLFISNDWDFYVYHVAVDGTILHSWHATVPPHDNFANSGLEKVAKWIFIGDPSPGAPGPAGTGIYIFELDEDWNLIYTGASIDTGGRQVEGIELGMFGDQSVLWTNNAGSNELVAYDMAGYWPVLTVDKESIAAEDLGDGDGVLELSEDWEWIWEVTVTNASIASVNGSIVKDNLGGDLELLAVSPDNVTWYAIPAGMKKGTFIEPNTGLEVMWTGKTLKPHLWWTVGDLAPGDSATLYLKVSTDINPGGKQEYTSLGEHCQNSGATAKGLLQGWYEVEALSDQICVTVEEQ